MQFKLEVAGYETIYPNYQLYDMRDKGQIIFNFIDIEEEKFAIFCEAKKKEIFLDEENSVICFRCVNEKLQFSIIVEDDNKNLFEYYFDSKGEIGFSAKNEKDEQYEQINIFGVD